MGAVPASGVSAVTVVAVGTAAGGGRLRVAPNGDASAGDIGWEPVFPQAAGNFTVPVDPDGTITVETSALSTGLHLSVTGYWAKPAVGDVGLGLRLGDGPQRLVDTVTATGTCNGGVCGRLGAWTPTVVDVVGEAGVGSDAQAVLVSLNVVDPSSGGMLVSAATGASASGLVVFDGGSGSHATLVVPVDAVTGTITLNSSTSTDLSVDVVGWFAQPARHYSYEYSTTGLRTAKQQDDDTGAALWRSEHSWNIADGIGLMLAEHRDNSTSYVVYGPGGTPIYQITGSGTPMYFHQDHLGSTRYVTHSNGTTFGAINYNAYGQIMSNTIPWIAEQPLAGYTGQYHDTETGYIYLRARHYDPTTGQFTSLDPLVSVTEEPYGYTEGNPANNIDPTGEFAMGASIVWKERKYIRRLAGQVERFVCLKYTKQRTCEDTGKVNAVRHFLGSAVLTYVLVDSYGQHLGLSAAFFALQAHEFGGFCQQITGKEWRYSDAKADQHNNALGMFLGLGGRDDEDFWNTVTGMLDYLLLHNLLDLKGGSSA